MAAVINDFKNGLSFTGGASADSPIKFTLLGGRYGIAANATWGGGSATLRVLMPDGTTYVDALAAFTADNCAVVDLPRGSYEFTIATATALQMFLIPVPNLRSP